MTDRVAPDGLFEQLEEPGDIFPELSRNGRICHNCFRLLRYKARLPEQVGERAADIMAFVETHLPDDHDHDILDREFYESVTLRDRVDRVYTRTGSSTACANCGMIDTHRIGDNKNKHEFREVVANLSATLTELGIDHDWVTLFEVADDMKTTPGLRRNELEILEAATTQAIEAAVEE